MGLDWANLYWEEDPAWAANIQSLLADKSPARNSLLEHFAYRMSVFLDHIESLQDACQSPIERKFLDALIQQAPCHGLPVEHEPEALFNAERGEKFTQGLVVFPQFEMSLGKKYRADFMLLTSDRGTTGVRKLVIECDGHDFHEKTKEQAANDKSRDRAMTAAGLAIMRFTGSEIHKDASACAEQACAFLARWR